MSFPRSGSLVSIAMVVLAVAVALALALPQIDRPFWHDEVATLEMFAASGPLYPFTDYRLPNNHPLSSAVIALMRSVSEAPSWLRCWPLAATLSACLLLVLLASRLGGAVVAWLAGVAFASSGITQAFALQLRGYAPSWPFLLLAALAITAYAQGRWRTLPAMLVFVLASLASLALLPSNLPWLLVLAAIAAWQGPLESAGSGRVCSWWRLAWLLLPFAGLLAYVGVFGQLIEASRQDWHNEAGRWQILAEIYGDMAQDALWLLPWALAAALWSWRHPTECRASGASRQGVILAAVLLAPLPLWLLSPAPPFSRAVVPWWPLMLLALAWLAARGLQWLDSRWRKPVLVAVLLAMLVNAVARETSAWRPWPSQQSGLAMPQTLLLHYYRAGYRPDLAAEAMRGWLRDPQAQVWSDYSDFPSLRWHLGKLDPSLLQRLHYVTDADPALLRERYMQPPVYLMAASEQQACLMLEPLPLRCAGRLEKIFDSGFFQGFRVIADAAAGTDETAVPQ